VKLLAKLCAVTLVIAISPQLFASIRVGGWTSALAAALLYGLLFVAVGWLIRLVVTLLSIVPGILTFGLFFFLVPAFANAVLLKLTAGMLSSFDVGSWTAAFALGLLISVANLVVDPESRPRSVRRYSA
jgi:uncharacterized membrane protein YvlD (DUF360 family)